jgi:hypothetical protein
MMGNVTDRSGLLGDWRAVLAGGLAVLTASVVTLVVRTGNPATADSFLEDARDTAVVLADGNLVVGRDGLRVPDGATVRTGPAGGVRLATAGRDVYLGALTTVAVTDGVRQVLERGQVIVDGRGGPRLALSTRAGLADVKHDALVRIEMGPVLRLGVFDGEASLTAAGRQATTHVPELYQVQAPYTGLPGKPTPLALTDDAWEQRLAAELVNADKDLNALAHGLVGTSGITVLQSAPVALRRVVPTSTDRGEQALSVAVAQASRRDAAVQDTLSFVQDARSEGGSWGVVAALVQARVTAVSALLDTVLAPPGSTPPPIVAGPTPLLPNGFTPSPTTSGGGPGPTHGTPSGPSPSGSPTKKPSASPTPSTPADDLITTVMNLLSPSPLAASSIKPTSIIHLP